MAGREYESPAVSGPFPKGWQRVIRNPPGPSPWITPPPSGRTPLVEPDQAGPSRVGTGMFPLTPGVPLTPGFPLAPGFPRPRPAPSPGSRLAPPRPGFEFDRPGGRHRRTQPGDAGLEAGPAARGPAGRSRVIRVAVPAAVLVLGLAGGLVVHANSSRIPAVASFPPAVLAGQDFTPYQPGSTRGIVLSEGRVASAGSEIVAVGAVSGQVVPRAQF